MGAGNLTKRIRTHYDLMVGLYYLMWGPHVHHGFWDNEADPTAPKHAQERLIQELYTFAGRPAQVKMLDVGCGYGGSLLSLARSGGAHGVGMTISPLQRLVAQLNLRVAGMAAKLRVQVADAQQRWPVADQAMNLVWCVECSEHLQDRSHFAREAFRVLAPGGRLAVAAWLSTNDVSPTAVTLRHEVATGMLCPPFATTDEYCQWFKEAGFHHVETRIITSHVQRTWDVCIAMRDRPIMRFISNGIGGDVKAFIQSFDALRQAYQDGAMSYGLLVAYKGTGTLSSSSMEMTCSRGVELEDPEFSC